MPGGHDGLVIVLGTLVAVGLIVAVAYLFLTRPASTSITTSSAAGGGSTGSDPTFKAILGGVAGAATGVAAGL